ncbi:Lrp/AsnC family transcriptional regulator [Amycolatopsis jejuensis]|uniref:Lrp/AsnC family transcriptional regulator n=1 Tax=Amycolatopsis jejuensis TaxID=330084 RepID=UPI00052594D1|nr:Lrp/AsnC family transcriptional regulator [Amycolatopsis jejuensis]
MEKKNQPGAELDDLSWQIIEQLQEDGRRSYGAIAKVVGLSEAGVRQRVQRMIGAGLMQIVAVTDPMQVGAHRQAMVGIKVAGPVGPVAEALEAMPEAVYVVETAGQYDLICEVVCDDDPHLADLLSRRMRELPGVVSTETFVYLRLRKDSYRWGTRRSED